MKATIDHYDAIVEACPGIQRKGKTVPYTSDNGYMFTLVNKQAEIGVRLPKGRQEEFKKTYDTTIFKSHGAVMKDYVLVPERLWTDLKLMKALFEESQAYVQSLPPK